MDAGLQIDFLGGPSGNDKISGAPATRAELHSYTTFTILRELPSLPMPAQSTLLWVTDVGNPRRRRDASTVSMIRKHVMKDIGKARRKPKKSDSVVRTQLLATTSHESSCDGTAESAHDTPYAPSTSDDGSDGNIEVVRYPMFNDTTRTSLFARSITASRR